MIHIRQQKDDQLSINSTQRAIDEVLARLNCAREGWPKDGEDLAPEIVLTWAITPEVEGVDLMSDSLW